MTGARGHVGAAVTLALVVAVAAPSSASAISAKSPGAATANAVAQLVPVVNEPGPGHLFAWSSYTDPKDAATVVPASALAGCPRRVVAVPTITVTAAAKRGVAWLTRTPALKRAYAGFARSVEFRSLTGLSRTLVGSVVMRRPLPALAAALRVAALLPRDAKALLNAATLLADVGLLPEAMAYVTAAAARRPSTTAGPMGIDLYSQLLNARGYVLLRAGQYAAATALLRLAAKRQPLLAEARTNLSAAVMCATRRRVRDSGVMRVTTPPTTPQPPTLSRLAATHLVTGKGYPGALVSAGTPANVPPATMPTSPAEASWAAADIPGQQEQERARVQSVRDAEAAWHAWRVQQESRPNIRRLPSASPGGMAYEHYVFKLGLRVSFYSQSLGLVPAWARIQEVTERRRALEASLPMPDTDSSPCAYPDVQATLQLFPEWLAAVRDYQTKARHWADWAHSWVTGLTRLVPESATIRRDLWDLQTSLAAPGYPSMMHPQENAPNTSPKYYATVLAALGSGSSTWTVPNECAGGGASAAPGSGPMMSGAGFCVAAVGTMKFTVALGSHLTLKAACTEISLEGKTPGFWGPYGSISATFRGEVTVEIGARVGQEGFGAQAEAKAGVFVTVTGDGVSDAGIRGQAEAGVAGQADGPGLELTRGGTIQYSVRGGFGMQ